MLTHCYMHCPTKVAAVGESVAIRGDITLKDTTGDGKPEHSDSPWWHSRTSLRNEAAYVASVAP